MLDLTKISLNFEAFDWDKGNKSKNWFKHKVRIEEAEQVFVNKPRLLAQDKKHSKLEKRYICLGKSNKNRKLSVIFTFRNNKIRIISARNQSKTEREIYVQKT